MGRLLLLAGLVVGAGLLAVAVPRPAEASIGFHPDTWLTGDLTGDGRDEVVGYSADTGQWTVGVATGEGFEFSTWGRFATRAGWQTHLVGDFTGDGVDEIASYHPSNGSWWVSVADGQRLSTSRWGSFGTVSGWQTHLVGDFTGDGVDEIASYHPSNGSWWVSVADGRRSWSTSRWGSFGTVSGWQTHLVGDFTGDGVDEVASYHPSNGSWWVSVADGRRWSTSRWARSAPPRWQAHLGGDLTGDGVDEIADHRANGSWWVHVSDGTRFRTIGWGGTEPRFRWLSGPLPPDVRDEMVGRSWHPGCPVGLGALRYVYLTHHDLGGEVEAGWLVVHATAVEDLRQAFATMFAARFPLSSVEPAHVFGGDDDAIMAANASHAFNCRRITGGVGWSEHSYGTAVDLNPVQNPYVRGGIVLPPAGARYVDRSEVRPGMLVENDRIVRRFDELGWNWGGRWTTPVDYMHLERRR
jgi:hypothetical protein